MTSASSIAVRLAYHLLKWAGDDPAVSSASRFRKILRHTRRQRRRDLLGEIVTATKSTVVEGPFEGLTFSDATCLKDIYIGAKLLGFYEREIQDVLASWRDKRFDTIINIGSASGFFSVGSSKLFRPERIWVVDIVESELETCRENFALNGLERGTLFRSAMDGGELAQIAREHPDSLIISDCEGYESCLFTDRTVADLRNAHLIIECHDFIDRAITPDLRALFSDSHDLAIIDEGPRDPNRAAVLRPLASSDRWLVISEDRPETMHWLIATPRR